MAKPVIISHLERDDGAMAHAAAAMYRIREPVGSTRLPFERISKGKQARNRELALQLLTDVFEKFPEPQAVQNPNTMIEFVAERMYVTLAPLKSEEFPFDQRTPFARTYYSRMGERFLYEFLLPWASWIETAPAVANTRPTRRVEMPVPQRQEAVIGQMQRSPGLERKVVAEQIASPAGPPVKAVDTSGSVLSSEGKADDASTSLPHIPATGAGRARSSTSLIAFLLIAIIILLLVLIGRTF